MRLLVALLGAIIAPAYAGHGHQQGHGHSPKTLQKMHMEMDSIEQDLERTDTSGDIPEMDFERKKKDKKKKKKEEKEEEEEGEMPIGLERFAPRWTGNEKTHALDTLKTFTDILQKHDIPYTLWAGTLLGAVRHKDVIPWDDDMDMALPIKFYQQLDDSSSDLRKEIDAAGIGIINNPFQKKYNGAFKIFSKSDPLIGGLYHAGDGKDYPINWAWPFTDVFMFKENHQTGKVSITRQEIQKHQLFDMEQFFPLTDQCKLGPHTFQCVANPKAVLTKKFGNSYLTECIADTFDHHHFTKRKGPWVGLPCEYVNSHMMMTSEMPKLAAAAKKQDDAEVKESVME